MMAKGEEKILSGLIKAIKINSRGWIEAIGVVSEDGTPIVYESDSKTLDPEYIAAATAAICGVVSAVIEFVNSKNYKRVNIELDDGRRVLIRQYKGYYIICLTRTNPNIGFIDILLEAYLSE